MFSYCNLYDLSFDIRQHTFWNFSLFTLNDLIRLHFWDRNYDTWNRVDELSFDMRQHHVLKSLIFALNNPIQLIFGGREFDISNVHIMTFHLIYNNPIVKKNIFCTQWPHPTHFWETSIWNLKCTLYVLSFDMRQPYHLRNLNVCTKWPHPSPWDEKGV